MLPLSLLNTTIGHPVLVELKNGNSYNGHLEKCDNWMNINLREVICTSSDGEKFWRLPEIYIKGNTIKYLRVPDEIIDMVREDRDFRERGKPQNRGGGQGSQRDDGGSRGGGRGGNRGGRGGGRGNR